eukprot:COSAG01_NODE_39453_length_476_cov_0.941645_1_plen_27_part_10
MGFSILLDSPLSASSAGMRVECVCVGQ